MDEAHHESGAVSRRTALGAFGIGLAGLAGGGALDLTSRGRSSAAGVRRASAGDVTVSSWRASRGPNYLIAHRGSGDIYPEHSYPAYDAALHWGAQVLEVSVQMTSDGTLICMHDTTYDRTTTITGLVSSQSSSVLANARLAAPWLGPAWAGPAVANILTIPLFEDVLQRYGGRMVLCVDAKNDNAYQPMMTMVENYGLKDTVVAKVYATSPNIAVAHNDGYPVFGYWGTAVTPAQISQLAAKLVKGTDYLVVTPANDNAEPDSNDITCVKQAVASGVTTWVGPVSRRRDLKQYFALGATGAVCSSYGYQSTSVALATTDAWRNCAVSPGELSMTPGSGSFAPSWTNGNALTLAAHNSQHFITMGNLSPVIRSAYTVGFELRWNALPSDLTGAASLAFAHADDRYYEDGLATSDGFHAVLRANGALQIYAHSSGTAGSTPLASLKTPPLVSGAWTTLSLAITSGKVTWTRTDPAGTFTVSSKTSVPGGYLHVGRTSADASSSLSLRNFSVT